ncbi:hypothetical protein A3F03_02865 [Candidatus Roizmanbacteria bacterium RIFCSPHIGHO2_12_FULL_41_11]|uniref:Uncharacterized protein n=1 Tax=Candidatus Roizmanbacteria bacterium RIFCSPHIGHO2_12_FULL_41_11 TaxID=1802052 RepID=A0A1F7I4B9_9BACT|nr:MAG: hypothetical protein A3F03_02865 [Candidatus Roizmanbacteria bacterium RIFCSPHIGHO2_12_FULL_41_11]
MSNISIYSEVIQEKRPLLKTILQQYGNFNIWEATNLLLEKGKRNITLYNPDFIKLVKLTFPHLDKEYLEKLDSCLRINPLASTADHQCPINHPVYINSNVQLSLFAKSFSLNKKPYIMPPILSFSSMPLNNTAYIRGLLMASPKGEKRFTFFGSSMRHTALPTVKSLFFNKKTINYWLKMNSDCFPEPELYFISSILEQIAANTSINKCESYCEQISIWNKWLWRNFFPKYRMEFLPIDLLSKFFFENFLIKNSLLSLYKFLFTLSIDKILELFDGIYGCWNLKTDGGTFFFWGIDEKRRMIPLKIKNNELTSNMTTFTPIKWSLTSIINAWNAKRIIPSLLTNYLIIAGHFGLFCSGAFNQIGYLHPMMKQYAKALKTLGLVSESERVSQMAVDGVHAFLYFLFGATSETAIPLCGLNMLQEKDNMNKIEETLKQVTVNDAFKITAPLTFPYIVNKEDLQKIHFSFEKSYQKIRQHLPKEFIIQDWQSN